MKKLLVCFILTGCDVTAHLKDFRCSLHHLQLVDSVIVKGRVVYRIFKCENNCGYTDTFPSPSIAIAIAKRKSSF